MRTRSLVILVAALLAGACGDTPTARQDPPLEALAGNPVQLARFTEYFPAYNSGFGQQTRLVVGSQAEWQAAWTRLWKNHAPVPPPPAVDFANEVVLLAAMGSRSSGGFTIRVQDAAARTDHVAVRVIETSPGGGCVVTGALSEPVDVVRLPRTALPVRWETVRAVHECG